jgi:hypothetical protein
VRFYELTLTDPDSGQVYKPSATTDAFVMSKGGSSFTTYVNGQTDPNALNVEIDVPAIPFNQSQGAALIRVWGIGLRMIGQAANLNPNPYKNKLGAKVLLKAGMKAGLPLANPAQAGTILQGNVFQAFGNWQGINQSLDIICYPPAAQDDQDISFDWPAGTSLASSLLNTFRQAFAQYSDMVVDAKNITIAGLIQNSYEGGHYPTLASFCAYIQERSAALGAQQYGNTYSGVLITVVGNAIYAYDNIQPKKAIAVAFTDLIGQPTWIEPAKISFKTVLRSDIAIGSRVTLPTQAVFGPFALTTQGAAFPGLPSRAYSIFQGSFDVIEVHHFGNLRQPDADSWVTAFVAVPVAPPVTSLLTATPAL